MRAMSLAADDGEGEQNELRNLQQQLESTNKLVQTLSSQLSELKEQVRLMCIGIFTWTKYSVAVKVYGLSVLLPNNLICRLTVILIDSIYTQI